ncbi:hypothetical protein, partial [Clostridium tarantellae]
MKFEYFIDNSNIKNLKKFILQNNTDLKNAMLERPNKLKTFLQATLVALTVIVVIFLLLLNVFIFPDATGNYFSFFTENFHDILSIFIPKILFYTVITIIFYFLLLDFTYSKKNKTTVSRFINSIYLGFKGMIKVSIKENEMQVSREFSNSIIESKIIEDII